MQWQKILTFPHCGLHLSLHKYVQLLVNWHCFSEIRSGRQRRWRIAGETKNKRGYRFNSCCSHYRTKYFHLHSYRKKHTLASPLRLVVEYLAWLDFRELRSKKHVDAQHRTLCCNLDKQRHSILSDCNLRINSDVQQYRPPFFN